MSRIAARTIAALAASAAMAAPFHALADEPASWQVIGSQGIVQVVIVPKEQVRDGSAYKAQLARLCPPDRTCFVNFYENPSGIKAELPLPDAIAEEATARFRRSMKNGAELFQWSCRMGQASDDTQCF